jgi:transglutaminase-like putative cysteine protease
VKSPNKLAWISGLTGFGLIALGLVAYRKSAPVAGLGWGKNGKHYRGRAAQAPIIGGYSDGNMTTTLREHDSMPIDMRVASIQQNVEKSIQDPEMRKMALGITANCPERDGLCEAKAVYDFIKARVRYTGDVAPIKWSDGKVEGVDLFQTARRTVEMGGGDCDDHSTLAATLLALNGITPRIRVVKTRGADQWEHVFVGALLPKGTGDKFIAIDTTLPGHDHFGREPSYFRFVDFDA